ncbi:hypothetical protein HYY70_05595 [Candidatus Woesearchaeota archaeon]|nr:hypothetical protein [Candidatus Woesearchaeota archaeon]
MKVRKKNKISKYKLKKDKEIVVHSTSLPYFDNKKVSLYAIEFGKMIIDENKFTDLTTEGGRFHQFYTYRIKIK